MKKFFTAFCDKITAFCDKITAFCDKIKALGAKIAAFCRRTWRQFTGDAEKQAPGEVIEFQPDALEIKNERLPFAIRFFVWSPFLVIFFAIIWACFVEVDIIVPANGKLVTDQQTIVMKPLERTVIKKVNIQIGDVVRKDQILITFDPTESGSDADRLQNEVNNYEAQYERLAAEFLNAKYQPEEPMNQFAKWQLAIYKQRQNYYSERINYYNEALHQIDASTKSTQDSLTKQQERLEQIRTLENMYAGLNKKQVTSLKELIEMQITRMEMEATVDQLRNQLLELTHRRGSTVADKNSFIQEWRKTLSEDMVTAERNLTSYSKELDKAMMLKNYTCLKAPCDAVVHEIAAFSPGSAVREAEALVTLVPLGNLIELEGKIRPQDIGKVKRGDSVRIKLDAYPFQKYGTIEGMVRNISEDTIQGQNAPQLDENGKPITEPGTYYRARITLLGKLKGAKDFRLIPGMQAQGEIKTGRRRVIEYALYPLIKAFDEAAREP